jgi:hypothetical protein
VRPPSGEPAGWLIGVVVGYRLAGFVQLDRVVWALPVTSGRGRTIHVAGDYVY